MPVRCGNCQADVVTEISWESGLLVWLIFGGFVLAGFMFLIPW